MSWKWVGLKIVQNSTETNSRRSSAPSAHFRNVECTYPTLIGRSVLINMLSEKMPRKMKKELLKQFTSYPFNDRQPRMLHKNNCCRSTIHTNRRRNRPFPRRWPKPAAGYHFPRDLIRTIASLIPLRGSIHL